MTAKKNRGRAGKTVWISWVKEPLSQQCGTTALSSLGDPLMMEFECSRRPCGLGFPPQCRETATPSQQQKKTNSVEHVAAEDRAFAAAKDDGSFISWRRADSGGDSHTVQGQVTSGVRHIVGNWAACAAMKGDGSIVTCRLWKRFSPSRAGATSHFHRD